MLAKMLVEDAALQHERPKDGPATMTTSEPFQKSGERGSALEKAILVLNTIATSSRPVGLAELAVMIDMPRPTIHRILQQLSEIGLILRTHEKDRYLIGPKMMQISALSLASMNAHLPVRAILQSLSNEVGETCNVGVLDQDEVVYIERVEGNSRLRLQLHIGSRVPIHCTSMGKLLVAEQHKNVRTRILMVSQRQKFTDNTLTEPDELEAEFARIRASGYSFNNEEYERGLTGVSVPIRGRDEKTMAALAVHAPSPRMDLDTAISYLPIIQEKAQQIAELWGQLENVPSGLPANESPRDE